ncbi:TonB-dependent receptor [Asticcacaulis sp. BYS171W]|uniref:TonB-dependent receptor n=1 Tax=Asticcacaulis aquaticus TaxID=2984212 RepID=A0ABT5HPY7_9CAUL|nr:TonB-dependent receptor [Asticcacaulis aquaticus]MDC7682129.1 TonB-dependent receptor [Asticcacaulis aquaticus]
MKTSHFAKCLLAGASLISFAAAVNSAHAQEAPVAAKADETTEVVVVGTRRSQQSAIDRKKRAKTATDSIVAEDVGSFPDRNLNEALSRVAGVAIARDDYGEGASVNLRGNSADFTRVEMDGMSVNSGGSELAINGSNGTGRAADLRELPADLIKSVDVVKGQTADMTEGGLGGSVIIQTRSGLDFKKPYLSLRVGMDQNTLSKRWSPDIGLVASRKFFDGRLGVIVNVNQSRRLNDSHQVSQAGSSDRQGYLKLFDVDGSPEKTFTYDPSIASGEYSDRYVTSNPARAYDAPMQSYTLLAGGTFNTNSALDILTKSAAAKTKADCIAAFPLYTTTQLNTITPGASSVNRWNVQDQRIKEQITCLNQWNDYVPNTASDRNKTLYEDRLAWDVRFDYRVNDNLTVYAKYQVANRLTEDYTRTRNRGFTDGGVATTYGARTLIPNTTNYLINPVSGFYRYNDSQPFGTNTVGGLAYPIYGFASNIVPGSAKVDDTHHVTELQVTNIGLGYDNIQNDQEWKNNYLLTGAQYRKGPLSIDFLASRSEGTYQRTDARFRRSVLAPTLTMRVTSSGLWVSEYPAGVNPDDISRVYPLQAAANAASPQYTQNIQLTYDPRLSESGEDQLKLDVTYRTPNLPFLKSFKSGASMRKATTRLWGGGGYSPTSTVFVPTSTLRGNIRACEATSTSTIPCVYGYVPLTGNNASYGTETVTRAQLEAIYRNSVLENDGPFMPGIEGFEGFEVWDSVDVNKALSQMAGAVNFNLNCMKVCKGSDGKMYEMPVNVTTETITAAYYVAEFEQKLPWDMTFDGNFGVRMVQVETAGRGNVTLNAITKNANWNALTPDSNITTTTINKPITIDRTVTDWLPSYNANLWLLDDKLVLRYHWSKTVTRPPVSRLWPAGSCTYDERIADLVELGEDLDMTCGTFGNPELKPYTANKNNTSLEWYVNKDTFLSLAYYRQKTKIGAPEAYSVSDQPLFAGTDEVDPATGQRLDSYRFRYTTYRNGPGSVYAGWEMTAKSAFTFLPWQLRYTGADFNISTNKTGGAATLIDPITGENLGARDRSDYFINLALWYDDGKTNARLAYQTRDAMLRCITACGDNQTSAYAFPTQNTNQYVSLPYNPGEPYYTRAYSYLDAKVTHKFNSNVEIYWEGRNLLAEATVIEGVREFSNADGYPFSYRYGGRRFTFGLTYKM